MSDISPAMVKALREKTGAGMMDCKKALIENNADMEASVDWLRKKGLAAAAKKAGRVAAEGLVAVVTEGTKAAVVEVNAETDFVARNPQFQEFVTKTAAVALAHQAGNADTLNGLPLDNGTVASTLTDLIAVIGENMQLRRVTCLSVNDGAISTYMHSAVAPDLGRIGVLVALESSADKAALAELGKKIAMHVAAAAPSALTVEGVDADALAREKAIIEEQAKATGRPAEMLAKMIEGRIRKYYEEVVLMEQAFVMDGKTKIRDVLAEASKNFGTPVELKAFVRFALGEGIEKEQTDFAAEVAAQAGR